MKALETARAAAGPPRRAGSHREGHAADAARGVAYFTTSSVNGAT